MQNVESSWRGGEISMSHDATCPVRRTKQVFGGTNQETALVWMLLNAALISTANQRVRFARRVLTVQHDCRVSALCGTNAVQARIQLKNVRNERTAARRGKRTC